MFEKIWNGPNAIYYQRLVGRWFTKKKQKQKILCSWHYSFKEKGVVGNLYISLVLLNLADVIIIFFDLRMSSFLLGPIAAGWGGGGIRKVFMPVYQRFLIKDEKRMNLPRHCGLYLSWTVAFKYRTEHALDSHVRHIKPFQYSQYSKQKQRQAMEAVEVVGC